MIGLLWSILAILISPCRSNARLEAENAVLRHQLLVLRRKWRGRGRLTHLDRWIFVQLYRLFPSVLQVLHVIPTPRRSCGGTGPGFAATGDGSPGTGEGVRFRYTQRRCEGIPVRLGLTTGEPARHKAAANLK